MHVRMPYVLIKELTYLLYLSSSTLTYTTLDSCITYTNAMPIATGWDDHVAVSYTHLTLPTIYSV